MPRRPEMLAFLSTANVAKLAKYFHVSPAVFIAEPAAQPPFLPGHERAPDARQANP